MVNNGGVYSVDMARNETGVQRFVANHVCAIIGVTVVALTFFLYFVGLFTSGATIATGLGIGALFGVLAVVFDRAIGVWRRWPCVAADIGVIGRRGGVPARLFVWPVKGGVKFVTRADAVLPDDWKAVRARLAQAYGFRSVRMEFSGSWVVMRFSNGSSPVEETVTMPIAVDGDKVLVGCTENGNRYWLDTNEQSGVVVAGIPGSGKTVMLRRVVQSFAANPRNKVMVFDGKGTNDFGDLRGDNVRVYSGTPEHADNGVLKALRGARAELDRRAKNGRSAGAGRFVVVVDEAHGYCVTKGLDGTDKKAREEAKRILRDLVALGRSLGHLTIIATQKPDADSLPTIIRDNCGLRACGRLRTLEAEKMVLGEATGEALTLQRGQMLVDDGANTELVKVALDGGGH